MKLAQLRGRVLATLALVLAAPVFVPGLAQDYDEFVRDFREALAVHDGTKMANLVKTRSLEAAWHVDKICTGIGERPSEELEVEAAALIQAWKQAHESPFAENHYAFLSLMRPEDRRERNRLLGAYQRADATFGQNANGEKSGPVYGQVALEMESLAAGFQTIGDHYYVGNCWAKYAACFHPGSRAEAEADLAQVVIGYDRALKAFDRVDLKHSVYLEIKQDYDRLTAAGWKEVADDPEAPAPGTPKTADPALAVQVPLTFEALQEVDQFERPNYTADEMYQMWRWLAFLNKGSEARFVEQKTGPTLVRTGSAELGIDSDRDGRTEVPIKLTGNVTVVECDLIDEGPRRKWAFAMTTGIEEDSYQGLRYYSAPQDTFVNIYYVAAASMVGKLGETEVRLIDENCDGVYGSYPWSWQLWGLSPGRYHWELDSMVIGDAKRALPWSEFAQIGDQWYKLESQQSGTALTATPAEIQTGKLALSYKGPAVSWLVVRGEGSLENCYFDLLAERGGVTVPAGAYTLMIGEVSKGKKLQAMKALMLPGDQPQRWLVEPGKTTTVELGGDFGFDFKTVRSEEGVTVLGKTVVVVGERGERYERLWQCVPRPEVALRKVGTKKGNKPEKMDVVLDLLAQDGDGGFIYGQEDAWFPLDTTFPFVGEEYEVQLTEKKNPLFGEIESVWK